VCLLRWSVVFLVLCVNNHVVNEHAYRNQKKKPIDYEKLKDCLVAVTGKSNKIDPLMGALIGRLDEQPTLACNKDGNRVLDVSLYGEKYRLSNRNGSTWMHWTANDMVMGNFTDEMADSCVLEAFESLPLG
jgi:hypothetical protein